ncbi:uncharacterized protein LOC131238718 [Magnolia sinica]|uniref:uncharacterized protein LOC131238718 n=1 Tax=Magnolia sinica TaxID=86752 RepID=UPI002657AD58|nr:uncharacterized protein LOC131238718 [Magnolia sinica]
MEATFCLSRHLCTKPIFTTPYDRSTIFHFHVDLSFHRHCSLPVRTLQSWPTQKAHRKTSVVNSLPTPKDKNGGDDGVEPPILVKTTVVMACVLGAICLSGMVGPRALAIPLGINFPWSMGNQNPTVSDQNDNPMGTIGNDEKDNLMLLNERALKALMDAIDPPPQRSELEKAKSKLAELIEEERFEFTDLQDLARKLKMTDRADATIKKLQTKYETFRKEKRGQEFYELKLILVEMLLYQGEYQKAITLLQPNYGRGSKADTKGGPSSNDVEVERFFMSDARPELYLAAAYLLIGDEREARKNWTDFQEKAKGSFGAPPRIDGEDGNGGGPPLAQTMKFEIFKARMEELKRKIEAAKKKPK